MTRHRELTEATFAAWNADDLPAWLDTLAPTGEYYTSGVFPGLQPVYQGEAELADFWRAMHEPWETLRVDLVRYAEGDDWTVVEFRFRATGAESRASVDMLFCNAARISGGRATRIFARRTFEEATEALRREGVELAGDV